MSNEQEYIKLGDLLFDYTRRKQKLELDIKKLETKVEILKKTILDDYQNHGVVPELPLGIKSVPAKVIVTDMDLIPEQYFKIEKKLKKRELNLDYEAGVEIPGTTKDNGGITLTFIKGKIK